PVRNVVNPKLSRFLAHCDKHTHACVESQARVAVLATMRQSEAPGSRTEGDPARRTKQEADPKIRLYDGTPARGKAACYARAALPLSTLATISLNSSAVSRSFFSNDFAFTASSSAMRSSSVILMPVFSAHSSIDGGPLFFPRTMLTG